MGTPAEGYPPMEGHEAQQQQYGYDPHANGLTRRYTDEAESSQHTLAVRDRTDYPPRSSTDPDQSNGMPQQKPKRSGKICGKCGESLTGRFVRALGDTYHLECFTCHVRLHVSFFVCNGAALPGASAFPYST